MFISSQNFSVCFPWSPEKKAETRSTAPCIFLGEAPIPSAPVLLACYVPMFLSHGLPVCPEGREPDGLVGGIIDFLKKCSMRLQMLNALAHSRRLPGDKNRNLYTGLAALESLPSDRGWRLTPVVLCSLNKLEKDTGYPALWLSGLTLALGMLLGHFWKR